MKKSGNPDIIFGPSVTKAAIFTREKSVTKLRICLKLPDRVFSEVAFIRYYDFKILSPKKRLGI
jgi:hypothetical protein